MLLAHLLSGCPIGLDVSTRQVVNEIHLAGSLSRFTRNTCRSSRFWTRLPTCPCQPCIMLMLLDVARSALKQPEEIRWFV